MQIKIFTIPIYGGKKINEEMNVFLRPQKVLQVESHLVKEEKGSFWSFCITMHADAKNFRKSVFLKLAGQSS